MTETCYRHPDRETRVSCSNCGRPICPDCMTPTPVGMRCPECAQQRTKVVRNPTGVPSGASAFPATAVLIAINVVVYLVAIATGPGGISNPSGKLAFDYGLYGPFVSEGELYRLVTAGFLHASITHIGFNMLLLFLLGRMLEPALGTVRFVALYFAALLAGSFGALLFSPDALTVGASGAVFGLFGAGFVLARNRGMTSLATELGFLIVLNLAFTFGASNISVGGHIGGLAAGLLSGLMIVAGDRGRLGTRSREAELAAMVAIAVISVLGSIAVA